MAEVLQRHHRMRPPKSLPVNCKAAAEPLKVQRRAAQIPKELRGFLLSPLVIYQGTFIANLVPCGLCSVRRAKGCASLKETCRFHGADLFSNRHNKQLVHGGVIGRSNPLGGLFERLGQT